MARKFSNGVDLLKTQLLNALFQNLAAAPGTPGTGQFYWDTVKKELGVWNGAEWRYTPVGGGSGGLSEAEVLVLIQAKLNGLAWKQPVRLATIAALAANTQSGSEATGKLTANANGVLSIDGVEPIVGDRILVKNEATEAHNGLYEVTTAGAAGAKYVLTRTADGAKGTQMLDATMRVEAGGTLKGKTFTGTAAPPVTVDTTALTFVEIESALELVADGTYLQRTGNTLEPKFNSVTPAEPGAEGEVSGIALSSLRKCVGALRTKAATNSYTITHNLNTELVQLQMMETGAKKPTTPIEVDWEVSGPNKIVVTWAEAPANTEFLFSVMG